MGVGLREAVRGRRSKTGVLSFEGVIDMSSKDWFRQLPLFVLVNLGAGALGATFNALHKALFKVTSGPLKGILVCWYSLWVDHVLNDNGPS